LVTEEPRLPRVKLRRRTKIMAIPDKTGFQAEIEVSESGRRYIVLRYGRIFVAKLIEELYTEEVFDAIATAYTAKKLSKPMPASPKAVAETTNKYRSHDSTQVERRNRRGTAENRESRFAVGEQEGTTEIPRRAELKLPILKLLARGPMENRDIVDAIAEFYDLSEEEKSRTIDSSFPIFEREVWGAKHLLKEEGLIDYPSRGESRRPTSITVSGLMFLERNT